MKTVKGNGVSIGTAIGAAFIYENEVDLNIEAELTFEEAVKILTEKFNLQIKDFKKNNRKDEADVLDAYILIMQDPEVINGINENNNTSRYNITKGTYRFRRGRIKGRVQAGKKRPLIVQKK